MGFGDQITLSFYYVMLSFNKHMLTLLDDLQSVDINILSFSNDELLVDLLVSGSPKFNSNQNTEQ